MRLLRRFIHKLLLRMKIYISPDERARHSPKFARWRKGVFLRDNYTCQMCGKAGGRLNPHHIRMWARYPKLRYSVSNGITLCEKPCHEKTFGKEELYAPKFEAIIRRKNNASRERVASLKARQNASHRKRFVIK